MIALIGALLGSALAFGAVHVLRTYGPVDLPRLEEISVDSRALFFAIALAVTAGLLSGIARLSMLRAARARFRGAPRRDLRPRVSGASTSSFLVAAEVALSFILLTGAGLLIKTFWSITHEDVGFRADYLLTGFVSLPGSRYLVDGKFQDAAVSAYTGEVLNALASLPGVVSVASGLSVPVGGGGYQPWAKYRVTGQEPQYEHSIGQIVSAGYFATLEIPLKAGRLFSSTDDQRAPPVAIVNERFARDRFGDPAAALGRRFESRTTQPRRRLSAWSATSRPGCRVTRHLRRSMCRSGRARCHSWRSSREPCRIRLPGAGSSGGCWRATGTFPLIGFGPPGRRFPPRFRASPHRLMSGFAASAVLLAIVGLYGVLAYAVAQRTREFGVKLALGARSSQVIWDVLGRGLRLLAIGLGAGLAGALAMARLLGGFLTALVRTIPGCCFWFPGSSCSRVLPAAGCRPGAPGRSNRQPRCASSNCSSSQF